MVVDSIQFNAVLPNTAYYLPRGSTIPFLEREKETTKMHILKAEQVRVDFLTECAGFYLEIFLWGGS